jgi:thiamine-phosphate pyrophosphorylase
VRARDGGASYATVSPIYDTPSKRAFGAPLGLSTLAEATRLGLPIIALGGIGPANAAEAYAAGAHGVAAIRAWLEGDDPSGVVRALAPAR